MQYTILNTLILNSLPIVGILFLNWESADLILLYGIETLFILVFGIIAICRLPVASKGVGILKTFEVLFFLMHFGTASLILFFFSMLFYFSSDSQIEPLWLWVTTAALVWHQGNCIK